MSPKDQSHKLTSLEMMGRIKIAIILAGVSLFLSVPVYIHNYEHYAAGIFKTIPDPHQVRLFAVGQSLIVFGVVIICALAGILYKDKVGLPGLGAYHDLKKWAPLGFGVGVLFAPAIYFFSDSAILSHLPELYPDDALWALSYAAGSVLNEEIVGRLGFLTIAIYFFRWRNKDRGTDLPVFLISIILTIGSLMFLQRISLLEDLTLYEVLQILLAKFTLNMVYGEFYIRKGLVTTLFVHFGVNIRIVLYALIANFT
jgi:hypothetical protein